MTIGTTIRQLRKERGLTLNQLAALIESDVGNLSRLERGVQGYSDAVLKKLSGALQVPVAAFFTGDMSRADDPREQQLVDLFNSLDDRGRETLLTVAKSLAGNAGQAPT